MIIEKGIPLPPMGSGNEVPEVQKVVRVLREMEVGDSVLVNADKAIQFRNTSSRYGYQVSARKTDDPSVVRFWLIGLPREE